MKHVYLTKEEIDYAYRKGAITVKEAMELSAVLNREVKSSEQSGVVRHPRGRRKTAVHKVA